MLSLGGPPSFSADVGSSIVTSVICCTSPDSIERFYDRTRRALKNSRFLGKRLNWITDTISLVATNLRFHAIGSDGEETQLTISGLAYLVQPCRLSGGGCSLKRGFSSGIRGLAVEPQWVDSCNGLGQMVVSGVL